MCQIYGAVHHKHLNDARRRGGRQGVYADTADRDEESTIQMFSRKTNLAEANTIVQKLGPKSLGVVPTPKGFALRHLQDDKDDVYSALYPAETTAYGNELLSLTRDEAEHYIIRNVDDSLTPITLAARMWEAIQWEILPKKQ